MPKLLLFAPCEKVLVDEGTHTLSLIVVLQEVHYKLPPNTPIQEGGFLPIHWSAVSLWQEESADAGCEFEQRLTIENPAGVPLLTNDMKWKFSRPNHRIVANIIGMPIGFRKLLLRLQYRVPPSNWLPGATFPIELLQDVL
jgi:hypothetical protein